MKTKILILSLVLVSAVFVMNGCRKDVKSVKDQTIASDLIASSQSEAVAQMTYEGVDQISDEAYTAITNPTKSTESTSNGILGPCATKTIDTISIPHTLTIDFGTTNCLCNDGKYRRGQIVISFQGHYRDSASVHSTTFTNFYVDDNHVMGTRTRVNNGRNAAGHWNITTSVNGTIIFATTGDTLSWNATHNKEWLQGYWSPSIWNDIFLITGNASGTRPNGVTYAKTILTPLKRVMPCHYFVSGTVQIVQSNKPTRLLDYGNGGCNPWATLTVNGVTHTIHL